MFGCGCSAEPGLCRRGGRDRRMPAAGSCRCVTSPRLDAVGTRPGCRSLGLDWIVLVEHRRNDGDAQG